MARERADQQNSTFVPDDRLNEILDRQYARLYQHIVAVFEDYFSLSANIAAVAGTDTYSVSAFSPKVLKLRGVDTLIGGSTTNFVALKRFEWADREILLSDVNRQYGRYPRYCYRGTNLVFAPAPFASDVFRVWYVPEPHWINAGGSPVFPSSADTDKLHEEIKPGWDEFVVLRAAAEMASKEQNENAQPLIAEAEGILRDISALANVRDAGDPPRMVRTRKLPGDEYDFDEEEWR